MLMVAAWMLYFVRFHDPAFQLIVYAGWAVLVAGLALIFSSMFYLRTRGQPEEGGDFTQTTQLVQSGLYAVVRHPLYLGWLLMYLAAMFLSQHWIVAVLALLGMASMVLIVRQEDRFLIERFGDA
jgi:protein-S-isoprenylcysteine O-methyltransferase Ste14